MPGGAGPASVWIDSGHRSEIRVAGDEMAGDGEMIYVGCYTREGNGRGVGIVAARRDPVSGGLDVLGPVATTPSPSFLAWHPRLPVLYAANEIEQGEISAWAVTGQGRLRSLGNRPTGGSSPCHVAVDPAGGHVISANYGSGSIAVHPVTEAGGLAPRSDLREHHGHGPHRRRQDGPHAHMISPDPDGTGHLLAVDLGTDTVQRYRLDPSSGVLTGLAPPIRTRPGSGPRHLARHPDGRRCYLVGELDASVTCYDIDVSGALVETGRVAASARTGPVQPAEIVVRADGRFLYVANRGPDTIAVFDLTGGAPRYVSEVSTGGRWPRHFVLVGRHLYTANERSDTIGVFVVDERTGVPSPSDTPVPVASPTCVLPDSRS